MRRRRCVAPWAIESKDVSLPDLLNLQVAKNRIDVSLEHPSIVIEGVGIAIGIERAIGNPFVCYLGERRCLRQGAARSGRISAIIDVDPDLASFLASLAANTNEGGLAEGIYIAGEGAWKGTWG